MVFTILLIPVLLRYGGKYEFNPYTLEDRERLIIDIRFLNIEIYSWLNYINPSWLKYQLENLGYENKEVKDYWVLTGVWHLGKPAIFNSLIDIKGPINTECLEYLDKGDKSKALQVWLIRLNELKPS